MLHSFRPNGGVRYGTGSMRERHDDRSKTWDGAGGCASGLSQETMNASFIDSPGGVYCCDTAQDWPVNCHEVLLSTIPQRAIRGPAGDLRQAI